MPSWDRQAHESEPAYKAFLEFRDMGSGRSIVEAYRRQKGKPNARQADGQWNRWVHKWQWEKRCVDWDRQLQKRRDQETAKGAAQWERRRQQFLERAWGHGEQIDRDIDLMSRVGLFEETVPAMARRS